MADLELTGKRREDRLHEILQRPFRAGFMGAFLIRPHRVAKASRKYKVISDWVVPQRRREGVETAVLFGRSEVQPTEPWRVVRQRRRWLWVRASALDPVDRLAFATADASTAPPVRFDASRVPN